MIRASVFVAIMMIFLSSLTLYSQTITVAVASNFYPVMKKIVKEFESKTAHKIVLISGSTGKQYAQVLHGAPFDILFLADVKRAKMLEDRGLSYDRFTYALGVLVLYGFIDSVNSTTLKNGDFKHIAIANPRLAPYGQAAVETLKMSSLYGSLKDKIVQGESVAQAFMFIKSRNAEIGFVALSQALLSSGGSYWQVPSKLYTPIEQQAVVLRDRDSAKEFAAFVRSEEIANLIVLSGYKLP